MAALPGIVSWNPAWDNIVGHVQRMAPVFQTRLRALGEHPLIGEARGVGLMGGLEFVADKAAKRSFTPAGAVAFQAARYCEEEGLILRQIGETLVICPPLIIKEAEIGALFDMLGRALDKTEAYVERQGLRAA